MLRFCPKFLGKQTCNERRAVSNCPGMVDAYRRHCSVIQRGLNLYLWQVCLQRPSEALVHQLSGQVGGHEAPAWRPHLPLLALPEGIPDRTLAMNT